jgi:hypothetical protein
MTIEQLELPPNFRLRTGAVADDGAIVLLIADESRDADEEPFTAVGLWRSGKTWEKPAWDFSLISVCAVSQPSPAFVLMSSSGAYIVFGAAGHRFAKLTDELRGSLNSPSPRFRSVATIAGYAYAVGFEGAVACRIGDGSWLALTDTNISECDLEAAAGFSADELYGVGWGGCLVRFDGDRWQQITSPTNVFLSNICCAGNGYAYAVGMEGTVLRGRRDQWEIILEGESNEEFWGVAWFNDHLYIASPQFFYRVEGDKLELMQPDDNIPTSCYHLATAKGRMLSVGTDDAILCEDGRWTRVV